MQVGTSTEEPIEEPFNALQIRGSVATLALTAVRLRAPALTAVAG